MKSYILCINHGFGTHAHNAVQYNTSNVLFTYHSDNIFCEIKTSEKNHTVEISQIAI